MRLKYNAESEEKKLKLAFLGNEKQELHQIIKVLETQLKSLEDNFDNSKKEYIEFHTQIKILKQSLEEKKENIEMLSEEVETWRFAYDKELMEHKNTKELVQTLEIKIISLKKDKSRVHS